MCRQTVELREVLLSNKPVSMVSASTKATVPVMCLPSGTVIDQSLEIMQWALAQSCDRAGLFAAHCQPQRQLELIAHNDAEFKHWLDRYKYHVRFPQNSIEYYREQGMLFIVSLAEQLADSAYLFGSRPQLADIAIMPFIRQFSAVDRTWFSTNVPPVLNTWLNQWMEQPVFKQAMAKYPFWRAAHAPVYM